MTYAFKLQQIQNIPVTNKPASRVNDKDAEALLGCTFKEYKEYIGDEFGRYPGQLSWETLPGMEIDHKIPISKFDISTEEGAQKAFNYKNSQPIPKVLHAVKTAIESSAAGSLERFIISITCEFCNTETLLQMLADQTTASIMAVVSLFYNS